MVFQYNFNESSFQNEVSWPFGCFLNLFHSLRTDTENWFNLTSHKQKHSSTSYNTFQWHSHFFGRFLARNIKIYLIWKLFDIRIYVKSVKQRVFISKIMQHFLFFVFWETAAGKLALSSRCVCNFLLPIRDRPKMTKLSSIITSKFSTSRFSESYLSKTRSLKSSIKGSDNTSLLH